MLSQDNIEIIFLITYYTTMENLDLFVKMYFDLLAYCENRESFDPKIFKSKHDEYGKKYSRLEQDEQGYIAEQIVLEFKR